MVFNEFLDIIIRSFNNFLNCVSKFVSIILENNFIKLILFIIILEFIVVLFGQIINIIKHLFSINKEANKNKVKNSNDIE